MEKRVRTGVWRWPGRKEPHRIGVAIGGRDVVGVGRIGEPRRIGHECRDVRRTRDIAPLLRPEEERPVPPDRTAERVAEIVIVEWEGVIANLRVVALFAK